jgi:signal transduction histidine kinase
MIGDRRFAEMFGPVAPLVETIFDSMPVGLGVAWPVFDETGAVVDFESGYTNPEADRIINVALGSLVGTRMREAIPGLVELGLYDRLVRVVTSGRPEAGEFVVDTLWGEAIHVRGVWAHTAMPFGSGALSVTVDITEQRRREGELRDFAAIAAHDLRDPLIGLQRMTGLLSERGTLGTTEQEMVTLLDEGMQRARRLVDGILEYATADSGDTPHEDVDCGQVVDDVLAALAGQIDGRSGTIEVGPLPVVPASRPAMHRVFQNLIVNALKFHDGPGPQVTVSAREGDAQWTFAICDNGIGLPEGSAIFEMFTRGGHDSRGSGIGLATCRRIIEGHGGHIWAEPNDRQGSTFLFTLPRKVPAFEVA